MVLQFTNKAFINTPVATVGNLPPSASLGEIRLVISENALYQYDGSVWINVGVPGTGSFFADGSVPAEGDWNMAGNNFLNVGDITSSSNNGFSFLSKASNISGSIAFEIDTLNLLTATGSKLVSIKKQGAEVFVLDKDGDVNIAGDYMYNRTETADDINSSGEHIIGVTDTTYPRTVTISESDIRDGKKIIVKDESGAASINGITIICEGSGHMIEGDPSVEINTDYGVVRLYSDGLNLFKY